VCHALLQAPAFFSLLRRIDEDLMQAAREGCYCHCGQPHRADYLRKARGCPPAARPDCSTRLSLRFADCRKRTTPGSARFVDRRVYLGDSHGAALEPRALFEY